LALDFTACFIKIYVFFNWPHVDTNSIKMLYKTLQPPDSPSRFACLYLRESRDSKWWNSNLIINWALLILFVLFPIVEIYRLLKVWVRRRNFIHHSLRYHVHNLSPPEYETELFRFRLAKLVPFLIYLPFKIFFLFPIG
jgi:hypothetical protein